jgi:hypothetical protein
LVGWIGALVAVVVIAVMGGSPSAPDRADVSVSARPTMTAPWAIAQTRSALVELVVRGRVARDAGDVTIRLETSDGRHVAASPADPTGHGHGAWVPFETRFQVARAARERDGTLYVVAVDAAGRTLGPGAQPFASSLFLDMTAPAVGPPTPVVATRSHPAGNDGLIGGIVFGIPMAER